MALDPFLTLLRGLPGESPDRSIQRVIQKLAHSSASESRLNVTLPEIRSNTGESDVRLYIPQLSPDRIDYIVDQLRIRHRNPYDILSEDGILVINSVGQEKDGIVLSGGSYSDVILQVRGDHAVIAKTIARHGVAGDVDGLRRHRNEAEWLAAVNPLFALFPHLELVSDNPDTYVFETRFFPAYSAAELVFQQRMTGDHLAEVLVWTYEQLRSTLYSRAPIHTHWSDPDQNYIQKVRRRVQLLLDSAGSAQTSLAALVQASSVRVNGRVCPSLTALLSSVNSDPLWQPIIRPNGKHACHGDLILEDVLLKTSPKQEVKLVDPNPYNQHGLLDLAKTMLSLWIGYEFVYFDFFHVTLKTSGTSDEVSIEIFLDLPQCGDHYATAATQFMDYARNELFDVLGLPQRSFHRLIRMASALAALAIPVFHVSHGKPDRALAFFALGMLHASYALADDPPPDERFLV